MTATTGDRLLTDYLARLDAEALRLPPDRRAELMEGIAEHVAAARAAGELRDESAVRTLIDRLGEPGEIVVAAAAEGGSPPPWGGRTPPLAPRRPGTGLETAAVLMLTVGSLIPLVGWLVGVVLLWTSRRWRTSEKLLGTLVVPGGPFMGLLGGLLLYGTPQTCTMSGSEGIAFSVPGEPHGAEAPPAAEPQVLETTTICEGGSLLAGWLGLGLAVFALLAPFVVAIVLLRRARERAEAEPR